jgi:glycosyltransferase involved in cell wall biosynthesis
MVHTIHIVPDENHALLWRLNARARVTAISQHQWSEYPELKPAAVIPHGADADAFTFRQQPEDYLLYLGRFVSGKGPLHAINAAKELGLRLILAGPENAYFRDHVRSLVDGRHVEYAGYVTGAARDKLLGGARALLYPIQHPEAFGLVLLEAMLCGTPVAAVRLGAVPEIVEEGITGSLSDSAKDLPRAVAHALKLDRHGVRQSAERRFAAGQMAQRYAELYERIIVAPL